MNKYLSNSTLLLIYAIFFLIYKSTYASSINNTIDTQKIPEQIYKLSVSTSWQRLVYYLKNQNNLGWKSEVTDNIFFLSFDGASDPAGELISLWQNLQMDFSSAFCKFPARSHWLLSEQNIAYIRPNCPDLDQWKEQFGLDQMSISFVSPYMQHPASMFGHTFLTFSPKKSQNNNLLATTINYNASIQSVTSAFDYITKGLQGGFSGKFYTEKFYSLLRRYNQNDGRDIWEYPLELSKEEISFIIDHLWEVQKIEFPYYYISRNCGFRILGLLAIIKAETIDLERFSSKTLPTDTIKHLHEAGLISTSSQLPSNIKRLKAHAENVSMQKIGLAIKIAKHGMSSNTVQRELKKLNVSELQKTLQLSYLYLSYEIQNGNFNSISGNKRALEISQLINTPVKHTTISDTHGNPLNMHDSSMLTFRLENSDTFDAASIEYRLAGHDLLDPASGAPGNISTEYLKGRIRIKDGNILVDEITFLRIQSTPEYGLMFKDLSWGVQVGLQREFTSQNFSTLIGSASFKLGVSTSLLTHTVSLLPGIALDIAFDFDNSMTLRPTSLLTIVKQHKLWSYLFAYEQFYSQVTFDQRKNALSFQATLPIKKNHALHFQLSKISFDNSTNKEHINLGYKLFF